MRPQTRKNKDLEIHWLLEEGNLLIIEVSGFDNLSAYHPKFVKKKKLNKNRQFVINDAADCFQL